MEKRESYTDWLRIGQWAFGIGVLSLLLKWDLHPFGLITAGLGLAGSGIAMKFAPSVVHNDSDLPVFYKDETTDEVFVCPPHSQRVHIDGINVDGKVYKVCDSVHIIVGKDRKVSYSSLFGEAIQRKKGSLLQAPPDYGWEKLFNAK